MPTGVRRKPWNVEKVETSTALHACRTIPSTRQNNSDHACATLRTVPVDALVTPWPTLHRPSADARIHKPERATRRSVLMPDAPGSAPSGGCHAHIVLGAIRAAAPGPSLSGRRDGLAIELAGYEPFGGGTCGILRALRGARESFPAMPPSFLRCSGDRPRVPRSHSNQVVAQPITTFARR